MGGPLYTINGYTMQNAKIIKNFLKYYYMNDCKLSQRGVMKRSNHKVLGICDKHGYKPVIHADISREL